MTQKIKNAVHQAEMFFPAAGPHLINSSYSSSLTSSAAVLCSTGHRIITRNKSASTSTFIFPFCSSTKLLAIAIPRPEPSVLRDWSPRTKRSVISSGLKSSSLAVFHDIGQQIVENTVCLLAVQRQDDLLVRQIPPEINGGLFDLIAQFQAYLL